MGTAAPLRTTPNFAKLPYKAALPAALLGSAVLRFAGLGAQSLWYDETYTAFAAGQPPDRMLQFLITDGVHPPLYYWLMAGWIRIFGDSPVSLRFPSAVAGALAVWLMYLLARRMAGDAEALLSAMALGLSPFLLWYSQDARMYSFLCLAAVAAVYFFWRFLRSPSVLSAAGLTLSHAALYGLHYFGVFLLIVEFLFLVLFWRKYLRILPVFFLLQFIAVVPLADWGYALLRRSNGSFGIGWIPKPSWIDPIRTILNFFTADGGRWNLATAAAGFAFAMLVFLALRSRWKEPAAFAVLWLFTPILMAWTLSQRVPIYIDRYLILCLPAGALFVSFGACVPVGKIRGLLPGLLFLGMMPGLFGILAAGDGFQKEDWRGAAADIRSQFHTGDLLLLRVFQEAVPFNYYGLLNLDWQALETNRTLEYPGRPGTDGIFFLVYWIPAQSAHSFGTDTPASCLETDPEVERWLADNFRIIRIENSFHGIAILLVQSLRD